MIGLISFFKGGGLKNLLYVLMLIVASFGIYKGAEFVNDKFELEKQVEAQELVIKSNEVEINGLRAERDLAAAATRIAEETLEAERARAILLETARQRALQVRPEDNGSVAPVLLDALDAIRGNQ